jgi:hypothetical protein
LSGVRVGWLWGFAALLGLLTPAGDGEDQQAGGDGGADSTDRAGQYGQGLVTEAVRQDDDADGHGDDERDTSAEMVPYDRNTKGAELTRAFHILSRPS